MDGKGSRRVKLRERWRRHKNGGSYRRDIVKFLGTHKRLLFTTMLLLATVVLLFGIVGRLQSPQTNTPPNGVTVINYSTLVATGKSGQRAGRNHSRQYD